MNNKLVFLLYYTYINSIHAAKEDKNNNNNNNGNNQNLSSQSLVPSIAPSICSDLPNWIDAQGDGCSWYAIENRCEIYGNQWKSMGYTANMACCACQGGFQLPYEMSPSISPSTPLPTASLNCFDEPNFVDAEGNFCQDYERDVDDYDAFLDGLTNCDLKGELYGANESCCVCGGGYIWPRVPSMTPSATLSPSSRAPTPQPTSSMCKNIAGWSDKLGETCTSFYSRPILNSTETRCDKYGDSAMRFGYTARTACCVCGGGVAVDQVLQKPLQNAPLRPMNPLSEEIGEPCIDTPNWIDRNGQHTCSSFSFKSNDESVTCEQYGHVRSKNGESANESCCICGGGYNQTLIGRTFRVSFPEDSDSVFTLFSSELENNKTRRVENSARKSGSVIEFMNDVAAEAGFGMYEQAISKESLAIYPNSTYNACLNDLLISNTDICIGPFWKTDENPGYSQSLFSDTFYLIVPEVSSDFFTLLITPFASFRWDAWLGIFCAVFYMGFVIDVIHNNGFHNSKTSVWLRCCSTFYHGLKSFTSGEISNATDDKEGTSGEKVVIASFAIFGLIILTAYTATSAAFLVSVENGYNSLVDVVEDNAIICTQFRVASPFIDAYPQVSRLVKQTGYSTKDLIQNVGSNECDVVLVSLDAYTAARSCTGHKILKDEVILTLDNVLPTMELLDQWGSELLSIVNKRISDGSYMTIHSRMKNQISGCDFNASGKSDLVQLTFFHLLAPFVMSLVFTTLGLLMFLKNRERTLKWKEMVADRVGVSLKDQEADELVLLEIKRLGATKIVRQLTEMSIPKETLVDAINSLPDKEILENLLFHHKCSSHRRDYDTINTLTMIELCTVIGACDDKNNSETPENTPPKGSEELQNLLPVESLPIPANVLYGGQIYENILNDDEDPKGKLIEYIISKPAARRLALYCGRAKLNTLLRSSSIVDNFMIEDLLYGNDEDSGDIRSSELLRQSLAVSSSGYNIASLSARRKKALLSGMKHNEFSHNLKTDTSW